MPPAIDSFPFSSGLTATVRSPLIPRIFLMPSTLDEPNTRLRPPAHQLRASMAAARLAFTWFGVRRSLTPEQKAEAADTFGAEGQFLSAGKKLIDTRHPQFKAVTAIRH